MRPAPPTFRPDWYPDPTRRFELRWHNGRGWTADVATNGQRYVDPLPGTIGAPAAVPSGQGHERRGNRKAIAAFVLGLTTLTVGWVPFLAFLAVAGSIVGLVFAIITVREGRRLATATGAAPPRHSLAVAGLILSPLGLICSGLGIWFSVVTIREIREYTQPGALAVRIATCRSDGRVLTAGGTIENQSARTRTYQILVDFSQGRGRVIEQSEAVVRHVAPGDTVEWSAIEVTNVRIDTSELFCRITDVTGPDPFD
jgi:hypothetical protein